MKLKNSVSNFKPQHVQNLLELARLMLYPERYLDQLKFKLDLKVYAVISDGNLDGDMYFNKQNLMPPFVDEEAKKNLLYLDPIGLYLLYDIRLKGYEVKNNLDWSSTKVQFINFFLILLGEMLVYK